MGIVAKSGEKLEKVGKSEKNGEKWQKVGKTTLFHTCMHNLLYFQLQVLRISHTRYYKVSIVKFHKISPWSAGTSNV